MFELGKFTFEQISTLAMELMQADLNSPGMDFFASRSVERRVEDALAEMVQTSLQFMQSEKMSDDHQQLLVETSVKALKAFADSPVELLAGSLDGQEMFDQLYQGKDLPPAILQAGLQEPYALLFPRLASMLAQMPATVKAWKNADWDKNDRGLEQMVARFKAQFAPAETAKGARPAESAKAVNESVSFDISDFPAESAPAPEEVSFTAMYPREIGVETWNTLLVYAHLASAMESVHRDSERFKDEITAPKEVTAPASTPLARGTEITIIPTCEGITFNPKRISLSWLEDFHRADFRFRADKSLADDAARGSIDIYVGPLIVGTLKLALLVGETAPQTTAPQEEQASMYHQDEIFISYSHKDTDIVLGFKKAYEAIGNNVLIDIDNLRSGQDWNAELLKLIDRAEIFQLYWSENSSQSQYCRQEWEYALKLNKGAGFIRPIYWKTPLPNPPEDLGHLHFEFVNL